MSPRRIYHTEVRATEDKVQTPDIFLENLR
jgi:hypothetical protein